MKGAAITLVLLACAAGRADEPAPAAMALFKRGVEALRAKDYEAASSAFQQSYALSPKAAAMCNLALTYDRWEGHLADAVESYRKCAEDDDSGRFRDHALERARELRARLAAMPPPATTPPSILTPPASEPSRPEVAATPEPPHAEPPHVEPPHAEPPHVEPPHVERTPPPPVASPPFAPAPVERATRPFFADRAASVLTALGVVGVGVGVGLAVGGKLDDDSVATTVDLGKKVALYDRAGVLQPAGYATLAVGAALVIAGVVEWAVHGRHVAAGARAARDGRSF